MGHSKCRRTFLHVGHTRSLYVYEAHSDMCAYVTLRGPRVCYIRYESGSKQSRTVGLYRCAPGRPVGSWGVCTVDMAMTERVRGHQHSRDPSQAGVQ